MGRHTHGFFYRERYLVFVYLQGFSVKAGVSTGVVFKRSHGTAYFDRGALADRLSGFAGIYKGDLVSVIRECLGYPKEVLGALGCRDTRPLGKSALGGPNRCVDVFRSSLGDLRQGFFRRGVFPYGVSAALRFPFPAVNEEIAPYFRTGHSLRIITDSSLYVSAREQLDIRCLVSESVIRCVQMPKKTRAILTELRPPLLNQLLLSVSEKLPVLQESSYARLLRKTTGKRMDAIRNRLSNAP